MKMFEADRLRWFDIAEASKPVLHRLPPVAGEFIEPFRSGNARLGWGSRAIDGASERECPRSQVIDFGVHHVGYAEFQVVGSQPVTLRFGEELAEVCEAPGAFPGKLPGDWLEPVPADHRSGTWQTHVDRRAFRYVRVDGATVNNARAIGETSALFDHGSHNHIDPQWRAIDEVGIRTLRNCMHDVFEDGPKRDRRLWLGDLRLQALVNAVSFRQFDLVKRCLYLFAALANDDGTVPACVFAKPKWHGGTEFIPDYSLLFGPTLLDYLDHTNDLATARDLWPVALHQTVVIDRFCDINGVFNAPKNIWQFIDWNDDLDRQASEQATATYALARLIRLGQVVGAPPSDLQRLRDRHKQLSHAAHAYLFDPTTGCFVSGKSRQFSWASQAWMILAGVIKEEEARRALHHIMIRPDAVRPVTPYLWHHVVDAMMQCGLHDEANAIMHDYWGGMITRGATTFWEVHDPSRELLSPYASHLHNSYCHAWSCTPSAFFRKMPAIQRSPNSVNGTAALPSKYAAAAAT